MLPARAKGRCKQRSGRIISEQPLLTRRIPVSSRRRGPTLEPRHETQSCPFIWAPLGAHRGKSLPAIQETRFHPWVGNISRRSEWNPLQHSCLENPRTDPGAAKRWARLSSYHFHFLCLFYLGRRQGGLTLPRAPSQEGVAATFQPLGRAHAGLRVPDLLGLTVDTPCFRRKHTLVLPAPRLPCPLCPGLLRPRQVKGSPPTNRNEFGPNQTRLGGKKPPRTPERENPKRVTLTTNSTFPGKSHS